MVVDPNPTFDYVLQVSYACEAAIFVVQNQLSGLHRCTVDVDTPCLANELAARGLWVTFH